MRHLTLLTLLLLGHSLWGQDLIVGSRHSSMISLCENALFQYSIENSSASVIQNVELTVELPEDIEYVVGSSSMMDEIDVSDLQTPVFRLTDLMPGAEILIGFEIVTDCRVYNRIQSGMEFNNTLSFSHPDFDFDYLSESYAIDPGLLVITDFEDQTNTTSTTFTREIRISNGRLGRLSSFIFEDRHEPVSITSSVGTILDETDQLLRLRLDGSDFQNIGNGDEYFDLDEVIVIEEVIDHQDCESEVIGSEVITFWGCAAGRCQADTAYADLNMVPTIGEARLRITADGEFPYCSCLPEGYKQCLTIKNIGNASTEDLQLILDITNPGSLVLGGLENSIRVDSGMADVLDVEYDSLALTQCNDSLRLFNEATVRVTDLEPNQEIILCFNFVPCFESYPAQGGDVFYQWDYSYIHKTLCKPFSETKSGISSFRMSEAIVSFDLMLDSFGPNSTIEDEGTYEYKWVATGQRLLEAGRLTIDVCAPCGLYPNGDLTVSSTANVVYQEIRDSLDFTYIRYDIELPLTTDSIVFSQPLKADCDAECVQDLGVAQTIEFETSCPGNHELEREFGVQICGNGYVSFCPPDLDCNYVLEKFESYQMLCPESRISDTVRAYINFDGRTERVNLGQRDVDDDRIIESGLADSSDVQLTHVVINDTIVSRYAGEVVVEDPNVIWDSLDIAFLTAFKFTFLYADFRFKDAETGEEFTCRLDTIGIFRRGVGSVCCVLQVLEDPYIYSTVPVTSEILVDQGCDIGDFQLTMGDSIYCEVYTRNDLHTPRRLWGSWVQRMQLFSREDLDTIPFSCGDIGTVVSYSGVVLNVFPYDNLEVDVCGFNESNGSWRFYTTEVSDNFFDHEFRQQLEFQSMGFLVPEEFTVDSVEIFITYRDSFIDTDTMVYRLDVRFENDTYKVDRTDLMEILLDEGFYTDVKPFVKLKDCSVGPDGGRQQAKIYTTISGVNDFQFAVAPNLQSPLSEALFRSSRDIEIQYPEVDIDAGVPVISAKNRRFCRRVTMLLSEGVEYLEFINDVILDTTDIHFLEEANGLEISQVQPGFFVMEDVPQGEYYFDICVESDNCEDDSLTTQISWACVDVDGMKEVCYDTLFQFEVRKTNAELELDLRSNENVQLCDTTAYIEVDVLNGDLGWAYDIELFMSLPMGLNFIPEEIEYKYPSSAPWQSFSLPENVGGNVYRWDLNDVISSEDMGLPGLDSLPNNKLKLRLKLLTNCELGVGKVITFWTQGENPCGTETNTVRKSTRPFKVDGISQRFQATADLTHEKEICGTSALLRFEMTTNLMTLGGETIEILLPKPLQFDSMSMVGIENISDQEPEIIDTGNVCILRFEIDDAIENTESVIFEFTVSDVSDLMCGEHLISASIFSIEEALCVSENRPCMTVVENGSDELILTREGFDVELVDFQVVDSLNRDFYKLNLNLPGLGDTSGLSSVVTIFSDDNRNQLLDSGDATLIVFSPEFDVNGGQNSMLCLDGDSLSGECAWFVVVDGPCICNADTAYFERQDIRETSRCDTICSGDSLRIGEFLHDGEEFMWISSEEVCDTCPFQHVSFVNETDSLITYRYTLNVLQTESCGERFLYEVKVAPEPPFYRDTLRACPGDSVRLTTFEVADWRGSGVDVDNKQTITVELEESGFIRATYLDEFGCLVEHEFWLDPFEVETAYEIIEDTTILPGDSVQLFVEPIPDSILWQPEEGLSCVDCPEPWARPDTNTTYTATIFDTNGCPIVLTVTVRTAFPPCEASIYVPNVFSPNGDNINDAWGVRGNFIDRIHIVVYDRWGEKVFETTDQDDLWDGSFEGEFLEPDVFAFAITADCPDGDQVFFKGNVTLLR